MKSDVIQIYSDLSGREDALIAAENFIRYNGFTGKDAMHIRLLTEELISMVHGVMAKFRGDLWFESEKTKEGTLCRICVSTDRNVDPDQEEHLLSVATSGKNENAKGIMGKIREAFRVSAQYSTEGAYMNEYSALNQWYSMGSGIPNEYAMEHCWSLTKYRGSLPSDRNAAPEEWDELEKSIVAKLSDDVKVWLKNGKTQVTLEKLIKYT